MIGMDLQDGEQEGSGGALREIPIFTIISGRNHALQKLYLKLIPIEEFVEIPVGAILGIFCFFSLS